MFTSVTALRRYIRPGLQLRMVFRAETGGKMNEPRKVIKTQTNAFAVVIPHTDPTNPKNWFWRHWPKSNRVRCRDTGFDILDDKGNLEISYDFTENDSV